MPNYVNMGFSFDGTGEGDFIPFFTAQGGVAISDFFGLFGAGYVQINALGSANQYDTSIAVQGTTWNPVDVNTYPGDSFSAFGGQPLTEGVGYNQQSLSNAFGGWPVNWTDRGRDGVGSGNEYFGSTPQTSTVGIGNGSQTVFSSQAVFGGTVSPAGPLWYNAASQSGAQMVGASIAPGTGAQLGQGVLTVAATTGGTNTWTGMPQGQLEPGLILSDSGALIAGTKLLYCITGCTSANATAGVQQTWAVSISQTVAAENMRADVGPIDGIKNGTPFPLDPTVQGGNIPVGDGGFGGQQTLVGSFALSVNGTQVCADTTPSPYNTSFTYNFYTGTCTGTGVSATVNYLTGDYVVTFTSAPAAGTAITASWINSMTASPDNSTAFRPDNTDFVGNGTFGFVSATLRKHPGGETSHFYTADQGDEGPVEFGAGTPPAQYMKGAAGLTQQEAYVYNTKIPATIAGQTSTTLFTTANPPRASGVFGFFDFKDSYPTAMFQQWSVDVATPVTFTGSIAFSSSTAGVLTIGGSAAVGQMFEGMVIGCNPPTLSCSVPQGEIGGVYILNLASGAWGAAGSTYNVACAGCLTQPANVTSLAMQNAAQWPGPVIYQAMGIDVPDQAAIGNVAGGQSYHQTNGFTSVGRTGRRWACQTWGALTASGNCNDPTVDRVKADANDCESTALAAPCLEAGTTYNSSHAATWSGSTFTITGGLSAHQLPFVMGQSLSCASCNSGLFVTGISLPPTRDVTRTNAGQVGNTFTITASGTIGGSGTGTVTGGCTASTGVSNCLLIAIKLNTTSATAIATCGENNLNGNAPPGAPPVGLCHDNGIGTLV